MGRDPRLDELEALTWACVALAMSSGGLPIGVQFAAPLGEDARLLALASWFEREQPWQQRQSELRRRFLTGTR